jgi:hypothetical protein
MLLVFLVLPASLLGAGYLNEGNEFFNHSGRYDVWLLTWEWWTKFANIRTGTGPGTVYALVPRIQYLKTPMAMRHDSFIWLHNEFFQVLIEEGVVGLTAYLALYLVCLKRAFNSRYLFSAMAGFGICALANYPFHLPIHAFVGAALVMMCLTLKVVRSPR